MPGRRVSGSRNPSGVSLWIAAVAPEPQKITGRPAGPPTSRRIRARACSRSPPWSRPVVELSVWVLAYAGQHLAPRMQSSTKSSARPDAV